jgi:hypothetical protein
MLRFAPTSSTSLATIAANDEFVALSVNHAVADDAYVANVISQLPNLPAFNCECFGPQLRRSRAKWRLAHGTPSITRFHPQTGGNIQMQHSSPNHDNV